jgi:hypothetical protein
VLKKVKVKKKRFDTRIKFRRINLNICMKL